MIDVLKFKDYALLGAEPVQHLSERDHLGGRSALQAQLHDRRAALRRTAGALLVRDERVPRRSKAQ